MVVDQDQSSGRTSYDLATPTQWTLVLSNESNSRNPFVHTIMSYTCTAHPNMVVVRFQAPDADWPVLTKWVSKSSQD